MFSLFGFFKKPWLPAALPLPYWRADDVFKAKLTLEDAKFIFDQAEKLLNDSVATSETIVSRMNIVLTLITGSLIALSGYIISRLGKDFSFDSLFFTASVGDVFLYILAVYSFRNIQPKDYIVAGTAAQDLFHPAFFDPAIPDDKRILRYYVNEFENNMYKTEVNNEINGKRWKRFSMISMALLFLPLILVACYIFTSL